MVHLVYAITCHLPAASAADPAVTSSMVATLGVAAMLTILPVLIITATSFIKISVVLAILRSALGAPGVPPAIVLTAVSAVLTMFVMAPVGEEMMAALETQNISSTEPGDPLGIEKAKAIMETAGAPLKAFLSANAPTTEVRFFADLAGGGADENGFRILLPAFATGELVEAFFMGFLVFIPFLIIDLIVSAVLLALGMNMLSPMAISLPLKLLLFVTVDGWHIILSGLLVNYGT